MYNKTIIRFGFRGIQNNQCRGRGYRLRLMTITETLIILDTTRTLSNNCLECDHITVNTTIYCEIQLQLDINQKFIYEPMTLTIYGISREKKKHSADL